MSHTLLAIDAHVHLPVLDCRPAKGWRDAHQQRRRNDESSHGVLYRTICIVENGIKPAYVFDGRPPELKSSVVSRWKYPT